MGMKQILIVSESRPFLDDAQPSLFLDTSEPEKRVQVLTFLQQFSVAGGEEKPITDESLELPGDMSLDEFQAILRAQLNDTMRDCYINDVYPTYVVVYKETYRRGNYETERLMVPFEITKKDDGDGDTDDLNIKFGEPKKVRMVPKVISDESLPIPASVLADDATKPSRCRLRGLRANVINANNRVYPERVLTDAIERAQKLARPGQMVAYE